MEDAADHMIQDSRSISVQLIFSGNICMHIYISRIGSLICRGVLVVIPSCLHHVRYWDPYYYRRRRLQTEDNKMNFIESVCD